MPIAIDSLIVSGTEDRRLVLSAAHVARYIDIGNSWTRIRIGTRISIVDPGAGIGGTPKLYIGVLSNPSAGMLNGPLTNNTSHYVGFQSVNSTWTRTVGPPVSFAPSSGVAACICKKIGSTTTTNTLNTFGSCIPATPRRMQFMVEITKGSPNFTIACLSPASGSLGSDMADYNTLKGAMSFEPFANLTTYFNGILGGATATASNTLAVSEADGILNSICVGWSLAAPLVYVSDIFWAKMA